MIEMLDIFETRAAMQAALALLLMEREGNSLQITRSDRIKKIHPKSKLTTYWDPNTDVYHVEYHPYEG
jgi:hypothetical protein